MTFFGRGGPFPEGTPLISSIDRKYFFSILLPDIHFEISSYVGPIIENWSQILPKKNSRGVKSGVGGRQWAFPQQMPTLFRSCVLIGVYRMQFDPTTKFAINFVVISRRWLLSIHLRIFLNPSTPRYSLWSSMFLTKLFLIICA